MARFDLSNAEWRIIKPLLSNRPRGVGRVDDCRIPNGIFYILRTGSPWPICPSATAPMPLSTTASTVGHRSVSGSNFSLPWWPDLRKPWPSSTAPSSLLINVRTDPKWDADHAISRSRGGLG